MPRRFIILLTVFILGLTVFGVGCGATYRYVMDEKAIVNHVRPAIAGSAREKQWNHDSSEIKHLKSQLADSKNSRADELNEARAEQQAIDQHSSSASSSSQIASSGLVKSYTTNEEDDDVLNQKYINSVTLNNGKTIHYSDDGHVVNSKGDAVRSKWAVKSTTLDDIKQTKQTSNSKLVGKSVLMYKHAKATSFDNSTKRLVLVHYEPK